MRKLKPRVENNGAQVVGYEVTDLSTGEIAVYRELPDDVWADANEVTMHQTEQWQSRGWEDCLGLFAAFRWELQFEDRRRGPPPASGEEASAAVEAKTTLPSFETIERRTLGEALKRRKSHFGPFPKTTLDAALLAAFLDQGFSRMQERRTISERSGMADAFKVCLAIYDVENISAGYYELDLGTHSLRRLGAMTGRAEVSTALVGQQGAYTASASLFLAVNFDRAQATCPADMGLPWLYIEAGRTMQEALVAASAVGLRTHISPAVRDSILVDMLGLEADHWQLVHTMTFG